MNYYGKLIGGFLGYSLWGLPGLIIGALLGHCFDVGLVDTWLKTSGKPGGYQRHRSTQRTQNKINLQQLFFNTTFSIMGFLAKADGHVSKQEIIFASSIMQQMNLDTEHRTIAIEQFNLGKNPQFNYQSTLHQFRRSCLFNPGLLKTFLDIQLHLAYTNGDPSSETQAALTKVFNCLGLSFSQFNQRFRAHRNYQQGSSSTHRRPPNPRSQLTDAYTILNIKPSADPTEIKKAYRRQMSKNHPDRLMAKGVPPEMIKLATQKTQEIKHAYEIIKKARQFS